VTLDHSQEWVLPEDRPPSRWRFGAVEVDEPRATVSVDGVPAALDRSSYEVLRRLVHAAGQVVSKEELLQAGWPGRVVTENSLAKAVGRLRLLIGDADGEVLRVVHGYGYRLATTVARDRGDGDADVATIAAIAPRQVAPDATGTTPPATASSRGRRAIVWLFAALALAGSVISVVQLHGGAASDPPAESIAVLPFADLSPAQDQAYFADGLADELLQALDRVPQLRVAGHTAAFAHRDSDPKAIGSDLQVATLLTGSVRRSENRIRVTVRLLKTSDGYQIWSQTYDRPVTEMFALQDDITRAIVEALRIELLPEQQRGLVRHRTSNAAAYDEYLLAHEVFKDDETAHRRSIAHFERAVELDPQFVDAWIALADLLGHSGLYADTAEEGLAGKRRALDILDRVVAMAPDQPAAFLKRGTMRYAHWWNWSGAEADFARCAELAGADDPGLLLERARLRAAVGRMPEANALLQRATEVDPTSAGWRVLGYHLLSLGQFDRAREALAHALHARPLDEHAHYYLGLTELLQSRPQAALPHFEDSAHVLRLTGLALAHHSAGDAAASERDLQLLISRYGHILPYQVAEVYAWRGESDRAFEWLARARALHDASFMYLEFDPLLRPIRGDRRLTELLVQLGLPATAPGI
jgi:eukaryotic-like serine/threonine-protein kinase